jgi:hypothetical protein
MMLVRRLRGLVGSAVTWALGYTPFALAIAAVQGSFVGTPLRLVVGAAVSWAVYGALCGVVFGTLTMVAEGGRRVDQVSVWRAGLWGMISAGLLPSLSIVAAVVTGRLPLIPAAMTSVIPYLLMGAGFGCAYSAGIMQLARRGAPALGETECEMLGTSADARGLTLR